MKVLSSSFLMGLICLLSPSWSNDFDTYLHAPLSSFVSFSSFSSTVSRSSSTKWSSSSPSSASFFVHACIIQGVDSGVCKQPEDFIKEMPFCGTLIKYPACVPKEYAWFPNHTLAKKDSWARRTYGAVVKRRIAIEARILPEDINMYWEGGDDNTVERFTDNLDCQNAYKSFLCYMNFPRCNDAGDSLMLCRSVCENFFRACKYESFLNRCYNPEYYGATDPEPETITDELGLPIYMRAHLPGQPFRDILIDEESKDMLVVCTPSIPGRGILTTRIELYALVIAGILAFLTLIYY